MSLNALNFAFLFCRNMSEEFDLFKAFVALQKPKAPKKPAQRGRGRGGGAGKAKTRPTSPLLKDSGDTEALSDVTGTSDSGKTESGPAAGSSLLSAGKHSVRNSRQRNNIRARCARAEARADALQEALKHCLEELDVLKTERSQYNSYVSLLKQDTSQLRAQLAAQGSNAQSAAVNAAADEQALMDLDQCIQSISS